MKKNVLFLAFFLCFFFFTIIPSQAVTLSNIVVSNSNTNESGYGDASYDSSTGELKTRAFVGDGNLSGVEEAELASGVEQELAWVNVQGNLSVSPEERIYLKVEHHGNLQVLGNEPLYAGSNLFLNIKTIVGEDQYAEVEFRSRMFMTQESPGANISEVSEKAYIINSGQVHLSNHSNMYSDVSWYSFILGGGFFSSSEYIITYRMSSYAGRGTLEWDDQYAMTIHPGEAEQPEEASSEEQEGEDGWFAFSDFSNTGSIYITTQAPVNVDFLDLTPSAQSEVPEPATLFLFGLGLLGVAGVSRRKK